MRHLILEQAIFGNSEIKSGKKHAISVSYLMNNFGAMTISVQPKLKPKKVRYIEHL